MEAKPLIGISAYTYYKPNRPTHRYDVCYARNAEAIEEAGGLPVLIPSRLSEASLRQIYERLDGVLLPGGGDIDPSYYEQEPQEKLFEVDRARDEMEFSLVRWAEKDDLPMFAICRGIQVVNVALGGNLVQDIPSMVQTELQHNIDITAVPRNKILHNVRIEEGSRLASIIGEPQVPVNSIHHQTIGDRIAPGLVVSARADDDLIEGLENPDKKFFVAVQWHPEDLVADDARMRALFESFVATARENMRK